MCADDARSRRIRLTPEGLTIVDDLVGEHLANEQRLVAGLSDLERTRLTLTRRLWGRPVASRSDGSADKRRVGG